MSAFWVSFALAALLVVSVRLAYAVGERVGRRAMLTQFQSELDGHRAAIADGQARLAQLITAQQALIARLEGLRAEALRGTQQPAANEATP